jgi:RimJ/RimL family protein N-acetyltransferase
MQTQPPAKASRLGERRATLQSVATETTLRTGDPVLIRSIRPSDKSLLLEPDVAELAIAVVDHWQGRGLGTELLHELARRASEEGVRRFSASVLEGNSAMLSLLRDLGDVEVVDRDYGVVELLMDLPASGGGEALRHAVRAAASGDLTVESRHSRGGGPAA